MKQEQFFRDLKVIELANVLAGPAVGMFFAELGASVIKIENKHNGGDVTRTWKLAGEDQGSATSAYFASVNWNKQHLFYDLKDEKDKQKVYELIRSADVVISNYKSGDDRKLGMDHENLKRIKSDIIFAQISGFGEEDPRTAYDLVLQAESGFMHMNGNKESGALRMPVALIDVLAAHQLKEGILLALLKKAKTGEGSKVSVSLFDAAIASLANQASNWLMAGYDPQPSGSLHPNIAPYGECFLTKDQKRIVLAVGSDQQFASLCKLLQLDQLITHADFSSNPQRVKNRAELFPFLQKKFSEHGSTELMKMFIAKNVPAGQIRSIKEVFENGALDDQILRSQGPEKQAEKRVKSVVFKLS